MEYHLYNLDDSKFENLINSICQEILGTGVIVFSQGKDGGRDGKFTGKAQNYPSKSDSWAGKFIIQAKHTINPIASCSDKDFERVIKKEIKRIKELKSKGDVDNYLLFTNRKYSGIKGEALMKQIIKETGVINAVIIGKETIQDQFLGASKNIVKQYQLLMAHIPFDFSDEEIKKIIIAFKDQLAGVNNNIITRVEELKYDFSHVEKEDKNIKNNLGEEYYTQHILGSSLMEFDKIEKFLNDPINEELKDFYYDTANELNQLITIHRDNFEAFEELFIHIYQLISSGNVSLMGAKRHITTFLHYMYVECLIGKK